jgi:DNA helicase-2/ATP-dependent DNA helicase PcrA
MGSVRSHLAAFRGIGLSHRPPGHRAYIGVRAPAQAAAERLGDKATRKRQRDIDLLLGCAAEASDRSDFLATFALDPPDEDFGAPGTAFGEGTADDRLVLSSIHGVKGREFEAVFIINAVDGALPSHHALRRNPEQMAEERRLLYVAMTRAKHRLTLVMPRTSQFVVATTKPLGDQPPPVNRPRFITDAMLPLFDQQER